MIVLTYHHFFNSVSCRSGLQNMLQESRNRRFPHDVSVPSCAKVQFALVGGNKSQAHHWSQRRSTMASTVRRESQGLDVGLWSPNSGTSRIPKKTPVIPCNASRLSRLHHCWPTIQNPMPSVEQLTTSISSQWLWSQEQQGTTEKTSQLPRSVCKIWLPCDDGPLPYGSLCFKHVQLHSVTHGPTNDCHVE